MNNKQKLVERHLQGMEIHERKQNLRGAKRKSTQKNQTKKPRLKRISINDWDEIDEFEFDNFTPIMPPGSREQRYETERIAQDARSKENSIPNQNPQGIKSDRYDESADGTRCLVIEAGSSKCRVDFHGKTILCDLRGNVKDAETGYVNPVAVGDWVMVNQNGSDHGVVESVLPRRSVLARPYSPDQGKIIEDLYQIVVANVDRLLIVTSWREPYIWPAMIDRYLISALRNQIEPVICINKVDLVEDWDEFREVVQVYENLDYPLILTSAVSWEGINPLKNLLQNGTTVLAGLSGVGKSTLLTAVQPSLDLKIGKVSESGLFTGQGRHTTTQTRLWRLENGGIVVDTPGVRSFAIAGIQSASLDNWYPEMVPYIQDCRFNDCTHINEPGCGVKAAVEEGFISRLRYKNYTQLYEELSSD